MDWQLINYIGLYLLFATLIPYGLGFWSDIKGSKKADKMMDEVAEMAIAINEITDLQEREEAARAALPGMNKKMLKARRLYGRGLVLYGIGVILYLFGNIFIIISDFVLGQYVEGATQAGVLCLLIWFNDINKKNRKKLKKKMKEQVQRVGNKLVIVPLPQAN